MGGSVFIFIFFQDGNFDSSLGLACPLTDSDLITHHIFLHFSLEMSLKSGFSSYLHCNSLIPSLSSSFSQITVTISCHSLSLIPSTQWLSFIKIWFRYFSTFQSPLSIGYKIKSKFLSLAHSHSQCTPKCSSLSPQLPSHSFCPSSMFFSHTKLPHNTPWHSKTCHVLGLMQMFSLLLRTGKVPLIKPRSNVTSSVTFSRST